SCGGSTTPGRTATWSSWTTPATTPDRPGTRPWWRRRTRTPAGTTDPGRHGPPTPLTPRPPLSTPPTSDRQETSRMPPSARPDPESRDQEFLDWESRDREFLDRTADRLAALPGVRAVALGGSRAQGTQRPDSDWDLAAYYRGALDPDDLRAPRWRVEGRRVDVHYRDLDVVEHELAEAREGRFRVEPLMFHLAGIPTYLLVAELALNVTLRGALPRPAGYPAALRRTAPGRWRATATA